MSLRVLQTALAIGAMLGVVQLAAPATASAGCTLVIFCEPPTVSITAGPTGPTSDPTPTFSYSSNFPGTNFSCRVRNTDAFAPCGSGSNDSFTPAAALPDGTYLFSVQGTDAQGTGPVDTRGFSVDTTPPPVPTISGPSGPVNDATPTFSFSSSGSSGFACRVDGGPISTCSSPFTTGALSQGSHTFEVRSFDSLGNDSAFASRTVIVDTVAPHASLTGPSGLINDGTPTFTFSAEAGAALECRLTGPAGTSTFNCSPGTQFASPLTLTLPDGTYTFRVTAADALGNADPNPPELSFIVDDTPPAAPGISGPPDPITTDRPTFTFSTLETSPQFRCRLDGAPTGFTNCSSPFQTPSLSDGSHTLEVRVLDLAGNPGEVATRDFTIITVPPGAPTITAGPSGLTRDTTPTFGFTGPAGTTGFKCQIDAGPEVACNSGEFTASPLSDASHTFKVKSVGPAGDSPATSRSFTVDTLAPAVPQITGSNPPSPADDSTPRIFGQSAEGGSTVTLFLDPACTGSPAGSGPAADFNSQGIEVTVPSSQTSQLRAAATDGAGNTSACSSPFAYVELTPPDTTPPDTSIIAKPANPTTSTLANFAYASTEAGSSFECRLDSTGGFDPCPTTGRSYSGLTLGSHTFEVRARDAAGNSDPQPASYTWVIKELDDTAPETTLDSAPSELIKVKRPAFSFSSSEPGSTYQCRFDQVPFAVCGSPFAPGADLADGTHTFQVSAMDPSGNIDPTPASATFRIDTTAPTARITKKPKKKGGGKKSRNRNAKAGRSGAKFEFTSDEAGVGYECHIDSAAFSTCGSPYRVRGIKSGKHTFEVRAIDAVGNIGIAARAKFTYRKKKGGNGGPPVPTPPDIDPCALQPTMTGTEGNDVMTGTPGSDVINALGGDDLVVGGAGDDLICGGLGLDDINAGTGDDIVAGVSGDDQLTGGAGNDVLLGADGNDRLEGIDGDDLLYGSTGSDILNGGGGSDFLDGGLGNDRCDGGSDSDNGVGCERSTPFKVAPGQ